MRAFVAERAAARSSSAMPESLFGYEVVDFLGQGAGSLIYVVSDAVTHQLYALKHVVRKDDRDLRFVAQLESEYEVGRLVRHRALRRCVDLKIERTLLRKVTEAALILELFDGRSLEIDLPHTLPEVLHVFIQAASALQSLHDLGYVHCDLKPNNILVNHAGDVKVIDLGQACRAGAIKERIQGTPDFMAPEQVKCEAITFRTDVFNFGATMYWALTGGRKLPTLFTLKKADNSFLLDEHIATPRSVNREIPETLSNLVMECVRTNPSKRPQNFTELTRRLEVLHHSLTRSPLDSDHARRMLEAERAAEAKDDLVKAAMPFGDDADWFVE
jgi:eukaryotic-like serine/threonine-protein kinase